MAFAWSLVGFFFFFTKSFCITFIKYKETFDNFWQKLFIWFDQATKFSIAFIIIEMLIEMLIEYRSIALFLYYIIDFSKNFHISESKN